jgi:redox-sensing transcriptional repressor
MDSKIVPDIIVSRLPRYLQALEHMQRDGYKTTSSQELGDSIGISAAQIRKDLSQFGEFGKQGTGYSITYLVDQIQDILHLNRTWDLAVVGIGDLGTALTRYQGFFNSGFRILLAFDNDPKKIGKRIGDIEVMDTSRMAEEIQKAGVQMAMITVPAIYAQSIADELIKGGVKAILNYAPISLNVPKDVHIESVDPIVKLQHMTFYLEK